MYVCQSLNRFRYFFVVYLPLEEYYVLTDTQAINTLPRSWQSLSVVTNSLVRPSCLFRTVWEDIHALRQLDRSILFRFSFLTHFPVLFTTPHYTKFHIHTHLYTCVFTFVCLCISSVTHSRMAECNWYNCQNNDHMCQSVQYNVSLFPLFCTQPLFCPVTPSVCVLILVSISN